MQLLGRGLLRRHTPHFGLCQRKLLGLNVLLGLVRDSLI